ncbi:MAG: serine protease [Bacteriovorax sp.]|nr:serine protease [Bacteriovorax sp.]
MKWFITFLFLVLPVLSNAGFQNHTDSIYDIDNRQLISSNSSLSPQVVNYSRSVALIFNSDDLIFENNEQVIFANLLSDLPPVGINICPDEHFANHHAYRSACTGFLVGEDLLATAGHCFRNQYACDNQLIAFDVDADSEIPRGFKTVDKNIYHCKEIVAQVYGEGIDQDYAIIKLDRKSQRPSLKIRKSGIISTLDKVYLIGHPLGLPLVYSSAAVISENSNAAFFKTRINSFHGNSGSPLINEKTQLVEGILVRGEEDLVSDRDNQCLRYQKYSSQVETDKIRGEGVTRIKFILPFLAK